MTTCDLCHQATINYRVDPETRVFVDFALRDLVVCLACDPQLPEATQKQRKRAEVAENEVLRLRAAEDLLRQSHMTTVRENARLREDLSQERAHGAELSAELLATAAAATEQRDRAKQAEAERDMWHRQAIEALKEKK